MDEEDYYYCHSCGVELVGDQEASDAKYVRTVANGELYSCPKCKSENMKFTG